ncbi:hypothetical protein ACFLXI_06920 [Chloroflexota bacterium]
MKGKILTSFFLIVFGIVMISGCGGATAESTADWNIYSNDEYGYSFKYPAGCYYGLMPSDCKEKPPEDRRAECLCFLDGENPDNVFLQAFLGDGEKPSLASFTVSHHDSGVFNPPPSTDLASWINENFSGKLEDIPEKPNMEIGGVPAVRIYSHSPMAPSYEDIWFFQNDILFRINILDVDIENNRALYDQILSTFRFED